MKNLVTREAIENAVIKEENIMETQSGLSTEAYSSEVVLKNYARNVLSAEKIMSYRNYDFDNPELFLFGLQDGETISEALLRRGAKLEETASVGKCHTDYFSYENGDVMVAVSYNRKGIGRPILIDTEDYLSLFKGQNLVINHQGDFTKALNNPMPVVKMKSTIKIARLILRLYENEQKNIQADHINSNRFDNRKENLRKTTNRQNSYNRSSSKYVSGEYAYKDKNDYRFGTAVLIERYFFREISEEMASVYNQILLQHFTSLTYSYAS